MTSFALFVSYRDAKIALWADIYVVCHEGDASIKSLWEKRCSEECEGQNVSPAYYVCCRPQWERNKIVFVCSGFNAEASRGVRR